MSKNQYRFLVLPKNAIPGDIIQVKYDAEGIVFDLIDKNYEDLKHEFGYDLYEETTIPFEKCGITVKDVDNVADSAHNVLLNIIALIEDTKIKDISIVMNSVKDMVYSTFPHLKPKEEKKKKSKKKITKKSIKL